METDERLQRIEADIHGMKGDITDIKVSLAEMKATIESTLPHLATKDSVTQIEAALPHIATKAEVEEAKHEATKAKQSLLFSLVAMLLATGTLLLRAFGM